MSVQPLLLIFTKKISRKIPERGKNSQLKFSLFLRGLLLTMWCMWWWWHAQTAMKVTEKSTVSSSSPSIGCFLFKVNSNFPVDSIPSSSLCFLPTSTTPSIENGNKDALVVVAFLSAFILRFNSYSFDALYEWENKLFIVTFFRFCSMSVEFTVSISVTFCVRFIFMIKKKWTSRLSHKLTCTNDALWLLARQIICAILCAEHQRGFRCGGENKKKLKWFFSSNDSQSAHDWVKLNRMQFWCEIAYICLFRLH